MALRRLSRRLGTRTSVSEEQLRALSMEHRYRDIIQTWNPRMRLSPAHAKYVEKAFINMNLPQKALRVFQQAYPTGHSERVKDRGAFSEALLAATHVGDTQTAYRLFSQITDRGRKGNTLSRFKTTSLLLALAERNRYQEAKVVLRYMRMSGFKCNPNEFDALLRLFLRLDKPEEAERLRLELTPARVYEQHEKKVKRSEWNSDLTAFGECQDWAGFNNVMRSMQQSDVKPDAETYALLAQAALVCNPEAMPRIVKAMISNSMPRSMERSSEVCIEAMQYDLCAIPSTLISTNFVLALLEFCKGRSAELGITAFVAGRKVGMNYVGANTLLMEVFGSMRRGDLIHLYHKRWSGVFISFDSDYYSTLITAAYAAGQHTHAIPDYWREARSSGAILSEQAMIVVMQHYLDKGNVERAMALVGEYLSITYRKGQKPATRNDTVASILRLFAGAGLFKDHKAVEGFLSEFGLERQKAWLRSLALFYASFDPDMAINVFSNCIKEADKHDSVFISNMLYTVWMDPKMRTRDMFSRFLSLSPPHLYKNTLNSLLRCYKRDRNFDILPLIQTCVEPLGFYLIQHSRFPKTNKFRLYQRVPKVNSGIF